MSDESIFPPEMAKYGLTFDFMTAGASFLALYNKVWEIQGEIDKAKASKDESVKVATHPFDISAKADKGASVMAARLVKEFVDKCDIEMGKNPKLAYWLAEMAATISTYFTGEMQYQRIKTTPAAKPVANSAIEILYGDRKALVEMGRMLEKMIGSQLDKIEGLEFDNGAVKWPNLQGAKTGVKTENPTGRYAKHLQAQWSVDGKVFPIGTDVRDIFRTVFIGTERNNRKLADIIDPIDKARKKSKDANAKVTVTINKHVVTYEHIQSDATETEEVKGS